MRYLDHGLRAAAVGFLLAGGSAAQEHWAHFDFGDSSGNFLNVIVAMDLGGDGDQDVVGLGSTALWGYENLAGDGTQWGPATDLEAFFETAIAYSLVPADLLGSGSFEGFLLAGGTATQGTLWFTENLGGVASPIPRTRRRRA